MTDDTPDHRPVSPPSGLTAEEEALIRQFAFTNERTSIDGSLWGRSGIRRLLSTLDAARAAPQADAGTLREALNEAIRLTSGAGNGTLTRTRPIEEWRRLDRLFRAALAASPPATAGREE